MKIHIIITAYAEMKLKQMFYLIWLNSSKNKKSKSSQQLNSTQFIKSSAYHTLHLAHFNYRNFKISIIHIINIRTFKIYIKIISSQAQFLFMILISCWIHHFIKMILTLVQTFELLNLNIIISITILSSTIKVIAKHQQDYFLLSFFSSVESRIKLNIL